MISVIFSINLRYKPDEKFDIIPSESIYKYIYKKNLFMFKSAYIHLRYNDAEFVEMYP